MPVMWRHFLKHKIFAAVQYESASEADMRIEMQQLFAAQRARFAALSPVVA